MRRFRAHWAGAVAVVACIIGCSEPIEIFDIGQISDGVYTNPTLRMQVQLPSGWEPVSRGRLTEMADLRSEATAKGDRELEAAMKRAFYLFMVVQEPPGTPIDFNPNIVATAEPISGHPELRSPEEYMDLALELLAQTSTDFTVVSPPRPVSINRKSFYTASIHRTTGGTARTPGTSTRPSKRVMRSCSYCLIQTTRKNPYWMRRSNPSALTGSTRGRLDAVRFR